MPKDYKKVRESFINECKKQDLSPEEAIKNSAQLLIALIIAGKKSGVTIEFEGVGTVQVEAKGGILK